MSGQERTMRLHTDAQSPNYRYPVATGGLPAKHSGEPWNWHEGDTTIETSDDLETSRRPRNVQRDTLIQFCAARAHVGSWITVRRQTSANLRGNGY